MGKEVAIVTLYGSICRQIVTFLFVCWVTAASARCTGPVSENQAALFEAIRMDDLEGVRREAKPNRVNSRDKDGDTPLVIACKVASDAVVMALLEAGAQATQQSSYHGYAIQGSAERGRAAAVTAILKSIHRISDLRKQQIIALMAAAVKGQNEVIVALKAEKMDLLLEDDQGCNAVHRAAGGGHLDTVELLLKEKGSWDWPNRLGETPLHIAAEKGDGRMVDRLIAAGMKPKDRTQDGRTAAMIAFYHASLAAPSVFVERIKLIEKLMEKSGGVNDKDRSGTTMLMIAADAGRVDLIKWLLAKGADRALSDRTGWTALMRAERLEKTDASEVLKREKPQVN